MIPRRQDRVSEAVRRLLAATLAEAWPVELSKGWMSASGPPGPGLAPASSPDFASLPSWPVSLGGSFILVDRVRLSPDLRRGEVWVHTLHPVEAAVRTQLIAELNKNARRFQTHIARELRLRFTPRLLFRWHPSVPPLPPVPPAASRT